MERQRGALGEHVYRERDGRLDRVPSQAGASLAIVVGEVDAGRRQDRDGCRVQAGLVVSGDPVAALLGGAVDDQLVDQGVGDRLERALSVAGVPRREHRGDDVAAAEPLVERRVDRDGEVGSEDPPADGSGGVGVGRREDEDPRDELAVRTGDAADLGTSDGASQFVMAMPASAAASLTMPGRSAASASAGGTLGAGSSRKPSTENVSYSCVTLPPASASRRNRSMSRERW